MSDDQAEAEASLRWTNRNIEGIAWRDTNGTRFCVGYTDSEFRMICGWSFDSWEKAFEHADRFPAGDRRFWRKRA